MSLKVAPSFSRSPAKAFVELLVSKEVLKPGFRQVLADRDLFEVEKYLLSKNLVKKDELLSYYSEFFGLPVIRLADLQLRPEVVKLIPVEVARKYQVVAYDIQGTELSLAVGHAPMLEGAAPSALDQLRQRKGLTLQLSLAAPSEVRAVIDRIYSPSAANNPDQASQKKAEPVPVKSLNKQDLIKEVEPRGKEVDLREVKIPAETLTKIPYNVAQKYKIIVFDMVKPRSQFEPHMIKVAAVDLKDIHVREILGYIEQRNKLLVDRYSTTMESFEAALKGYPAQAPAPKMPVTSAPAVEKEKVKVPEQKTEDVPKAPSAPKTTSPVEDMAMQQKKEEDTPVVEGVTLSANEVPDKLKVDDTVVPTPGGTGGVVPEQRMGIDDQDLDQLLKSPVTSADDLAKIFRGGVVPEVVAGLIFLAIRMKASDVHIEAEQKSVRIRFRIDGVLHDIIRVPQFLHGPLISRVKILSKMKIDEQRVPQDGRFDVTVDKRQVDLRVSTLPTVHGEKVVLRLLDKSGGVLTLEELGVTGSNFDTLIANVKKPDGIILSTGPTGSGKSTTLYAILSRISKPGVNIITLEDPVEYELPGLNQAQVKPQIGFTFAEGLRSVLRQDPNIIMVGEVRDLETAAMATHAALTGHLVLSTLHTNDAAGALPRLINMGVEPFLITSSINAVIGQRLVRKICNQCREKVDIPPAVKGFIQKEIAAIPSGQLKNVDLDQLVFYHGRGCPDCTNGYTGRIGIFEVLTMTDEIEDLAVRKAPATDIKKAAIKSGMVTMIQDGLIKALKGITTVDEVMRVTTSEIKEVPN